MKIYFDLISVLFFVYVMYQNLSVQTPIYTNPGLSANQSLIPSISKRLCLIHTILSDKTQIFKT